MAAELERAAAELERDGLTHLRGVLDPSAVAEMRALFEAELGALVDGSRPRKDDEGTGEQHGAPGEPNRGPRRWYMSVTPAAPFLRVLEVEPIFALLARAFGDADAVLTNIGSDTPLGRGSDFQACERDQPHHLRERVCPSR